MIVKIAETFCLEKSDKGIFLGTAYFGDDIPDLLAMKMCEYAGCPSDAVNEIKAISDFICEKKGGEGAVREFIEWLVRKCRV